MSVLELFRSPQPILELFVKYRMTEKNATFKRTLMKTSYFQKRKIVQVYEFIYLSQDAVWFIHFLDYGFKNKYTEHIFNTSSVQNSVLW